MARLLVIAALSLVASIGHADAQATLCAQLQGATIVANDGQFLGNLSSPYDPNSVLNEYGTYGSRYQPNSIWNDYGTYGGKYSAMSPFNAYSSSPPEIIINGRAVAYLTVNKYLQPSVNPYVLESCK